MSSAFANRRIEPVYEDDAVAVVVAGQPDYPRDLGHSSNVGAYNTYSARTLGPKYPAHDANAPIFEGKDIAALIAATIITLGPLAAVSLGL